MNKILKILIVLSGLFFYKMLDARDRFYPAQFIFFCASILSVLSYLIYKKNKWMGLLSCLFTFVVFKTFLLQQAPELHFFKAAFFGSLIFVFYYLLKNITLDKQILKYLLIPACLNIALIIIQFFDGAFLSFMPVEGVTGFLGNKAVTACYLGVSAPIFLEYFPIGIPFLIIALLLAKSTIGIAICFVSMVTYIILKRKAVFFRELSCFALIIVLLITLGLFREKLIQSLHIRASTYVGTLDGIKNNPILGWGLGSYEPIMTRVAFNDDMQFLGLKFSSLNNGIMWHPHNELLFGWWNLGILFPIFILFYAINIFKKKTKEIVSFSILSGIFIASIFYFLSPPLIFLLILTLSIYEREGEQDADNRT